MATYSITEDPKWEWVKLITINTNRDIDISSEFFNITVKDQLEYFVADHIKEGSTFELEELFKKDTFPTLEISNNAVQYARQRCFTCTTEENKSEEPVYPTTIKCPECKGTGWKYLGIRQVIPCPRCSDGQHAGSGYFICPDCSGYGYAHTICSDEPMLTEQYISNVQAYNNSDDDTLIKNGIQFWVDGVNKRTMYIRVVTKGQSTSNTSGYIVWNPVSADYVPTEYVGFTIANFNITLNGSERLVFNCFNIPRVVMGNPIPSSTNYTVPSAWEEEPHVLSGNIRTDYMWNYDYNKSEYGYNSLFVNNTSGTSAYLYEQTSADDGIHWNTKSPVPKKPFITPVYCVKSSAYLNDYLVNGETTDLYLSTPDSAVTAERGFEFTESSVKSYLINEYSKKKIPLYFDFPQEPILMDEYKFIEANGNCVSSDVYCYEIIQKIEDSSCSGLMRDNQIRLDLEI